MNARHVVIPGVGVFLLSPDRSRIVLGRRLGAHGDGLFATPGGHIDEGETIEEAASRELTEETGIRLPPSAFSLVAVVDFMPPAWDMPYVMFYCAAVYDGAGSVRVMEPNKCAGWEWYPLDALPNDVYIPSHATTGALAEWLTTGVVVRRTVR